MSKKDDKLMASLFNKIAEGKVTEEDVRFFLMECFRNSSLAKQIKNVPKIIFTSELGKTTLGLYEGAEIVYINSSMLDDVFSKRPGAIGEILNTFGHEATHYFQKERESYVDINRFTVEGANKVYDILGLGKNGGDREAGIYMIYYSSYLHCRAEEEARQGGFYFEKEIFEMFENNKYIKRGLSKFLLLEKKFCLETEKKREKKERDFFYPYHDEFTKLCCLDATFAKVMNFDIAHNPMEDPLDQADFAAIYGICQIRTRELSAEIIAKDYLNACLLDANQVPLAYITALKDGSCSPEKVGEVKNHLMKAILRGVVNKEANVKKIMNSSLAGFLEDNQVISVYKTVLSNNLENINSIFFRRFLFVNEDNARLLCKTLINAYKEGDINIDSEQDYMNFQKHLNFLLESPAIKEVSPAIQMELTALAGSFGVKVDSNKNTVSV